MAVASPMLRFRCPTCHSALQLPATRGGEQARCPWCGRLMVVPTPTAPSTVRLVPPAGIGGSVVPARTVTYLHHTRDPGGDVVFYFTDPAVDGIREVWQSSPVRGLRRLPTAVIDRRGHGSLSRYRISTEHSEYEVLIPADKAGHLATELGLSLTELAAEMEKAGGA